MPQTGSTPIQHYRSTTPGAAPSASNLTAGELGFNINDADMALYAKNNSGTVKRIINNPAGLKYPTSDGSANYVIKTDGSGTLSFGVVNVSAGGTGVTTTPSNGQLLIGNGSGYTVANLTAGANITITNTAGGISIASTGGTSLLGQTDSTSPYETSLGYLAGSNNTGVYNTFVGAQAGIANVTGERSVVVGYNAANSASYVGNVVAVGYQAGKNYTGTNAYVAIGADAFSGTGGMVESVGVGKSVGANMTSGQWNVFVGHEAATNRTSGDNNVFVGYLSGSYSGATGSDNVGVGHLTLSSATTAGYNIAVGTSAGRGLTTGVSNLLIGSFAGYVGLATDLTTGSGNILIGNSAQASSATVSNEVTLGSDSITSTRLRGLVQHNAAILEQATLVSAAATGTIDYDVRSNSVVYYYNGGAANFTLNFRGTSSVPLNSVMATSQTITLAFILNNGATAYYPNTIQIDGTATNVLWQGGTAPTAGNANARDVYVFTIIKIGASTYVVFGSQTKFA